MVKLSPANPGHLFQIQIMRRQIFGAGPECQWTVEWPYLGGIGASKLGLTMVYHIFAMAKIGKVKREFQRQASDIFVQVDLWRERSFFRIASRSCCPVAAPPPTPECYSVLMTPQNHTKTASNK